MQEGRPLAFHSESLKGRCLHLSTYEKEFLAVVKAVKKWRPYLVGKPFVIKTNHQSLKFLLEQRVGTLTQQKWITKLLGYSFVVEYKKGRDIKAADALSRTMEGVLNSMVSVSADTDEDNDLGYANQNVALFLTSFPCPSWLSILQDSYLNEQEYRHLLASFTSNNSPTGFSLHNGIILYECSFSFKTFGFTAHA